MDLFAELLKITIPAAIVLLAVYLMMNKFFNNEQKRRQLDVRLENLKMVTPIRLQAYERLILFLERINPESLIIRVHQEGMSAKSFHKQLVRTMRSEYEHNITQQMYVTQGAWNMVTNANANIIKLFNLTLAEMDEDASSLDFSKEIVKAVQQAKDLPTNVAIRYLKDEVRRLF